MAEDREIFRPPVGTGSMELKMSKDDTDGAFSVFLQTLPAGEGTNTHLHENCREACYVIEGEVTVSLDGVIRKYAAGDSFFAPIRVPHAISNFGERTARFLVITTPGGLESFFRAIEGHQESGSGDAQSVRQIAQQHGMKVVGPALENQFA